MENTKDIIIGLNATEKNFLVDKIVEYNISKVSTDQDPLFEEINLAIKDKSGEIIAGLLAKIYCWHSAYLDTVWVEESKRNQNLGNQLLAKLEEILLQKNCRVIHLDTFDFQAPQFYEKNGYTLFGKLPDTPKGHSRYYYCKFLKQD